MKKLLMIMVATAFASPVFASDVESGHKTEVDTSKNPITGTKTITKTTKSKDKGPHAKAETEVTEKTKIKKNGKVEHSKEVESDSSSESK